MTTIEITKIKNLVYGYKTKHEAGFIKSEIEDLKSKIPIISKEKFNSALNGITCQADPDDGFIIYPCDIFNAFLCGAENRNLTEAEFD